MSYEHRTRLYNFQPSRPTLSPQTAHVLNHRCWRHLSNKLKTLPTTEPPKFALWNSHRQAGQPTLASAAFVSLVPCTFVG